MRRLFLCTAAMSALLTPTLLAQTASDGGVGVTTEDFNGRVYGDDVPALLTGVWQGSDRLVYFGDDDDEITIALRLFYGWYADRTAEPARFAEDAARVRNDATTATAERITVRYATLAENNSQTAGAYELEVRYEGQSAPVYIPLAVIDGSIYLDFLVRENTSGVLLTGDVTDAASRNIADGFWRDCGAARAVSVSPPIRSKELTSYYVAADTCYRIRYWQTEMPFTTEVADFIDGDKRFTVDKYILAGGGVYTCCTGRRTRIRGVKKEVTFQRPYTLDADGVICGVGTAYLVRMDSDGQTDEQTVLSAVTASQRAPAPKPLFPPPLPSVRVPDYDELAIQDPATWSRRNLDVGK